MAKLIRESEGLTVGIDLGDKYSRLCMLDESGEVVEESRFPTTVSSVRRRFAEMARCRIAIEVGSQSPWVGRLLEELGHQVLVANARKVRLIHGGEDKDDRLDAEHLARLARVDPRLLWPIQPRGAQVQADRGLLRSRDVLVGCRTKLINHIRGLSKSLGVRLRSCSASSFPRRIVEDLPEELQSVVTPVLAMIESLTRKIRHYDRRIEKISTERYPATILLRQVTGVGPLTALSYVLTLEDPKRFRNSRSLGAYVGLRPKRHQSGESDPELRITKAGDRYLRRMLVGSAQYILGPFGPDTDLRRWGLALAGRGRKNAKKRAIVAVARKLAVLLHRLWVTAEEYEPLRSSTRVGTQRAATA